MTKEHLWPQWLSRADPTAKSLHGKGLGRGRYVMQAINVSDELTVAHYRSPGYALSRKDDVVRAVCADCNNGWLAALEEQAKPILVRQMKDRADVLTDAERDVLVRWLTKTMAIYEMTDAATAVIPEYERRTIAAGTPSPAHWRIHSLMVAKPDYEYGHWHAAELEAESAEPDAERVVVVLRQFITVGPAAYVLEWWADGFAGQSHPMGAQRCVTLWPDLAERQVRFAPTDGQLDRLYRRMHAGLPQPFLSRRTSRIGRLGR